MAELTPLSILITADADGLQTELTSAQSKVAGFESSLTKGTKASGNFSKGLSGLGNVSNRTRAQIQNASFQLQDIVVQLQMGTSVSRTLSQQLPQLAGGFGAVGAAVGLLAGIGIPAVATAMQAAGTEAYDFDDSLEAIKDTIESMQEPMSILKMDMDELRDKYGEAAEAVLKYAQFQAQSRAASAAESLREEISTLDKVINRYSDVVDAGRSYRNTIKDIQEDLGLGREQAILFENALSNMRDAMTFEESKAALQDVIDLLDQNQIAASEIPPELRRAIDEMLTLTIATDEARRLMALLSNEAASVSIGSGWEFDPNTDMPPALVEDEKKTKKGGAAKVNPIIAQLEQVRTALSTQEELEAASFAKQQETLTSALTQKLITQQEFNALTEEAQKQHADRMTQIDAYRYGSALDQSQQFFGDMATALSSGNSKMVDISEKFAKVEALINAGRAFAQVAADPTLPWYAKIPAAAGVGAAISSFSNSAGIGSSTSSTASSVAAADTSASQYFQVSISGDTIRTDAVAELFATIQSGLEDGYTLGGITLA